MPALPDRELDIPQVVRTVVSVRCASTEQFHHVFTCSLVVGRLCASCVDEVSVEFISQSSREQKILGPSDTMILWRAHVSLLILCCDWCTMLSRLQSVFFQLSICLRFALHSMLLVGVTGTLRPLVA